MVRLTIAQVIYADSPPHLRLNCPFHAVGLFFLCYHKTAQGGDAVNLSFTELYQNVE